MTWTGTTGAKHRPLIKATPIFESQELRFQQPTSRPCPVLDSNDLNRHSCTRENLLRGCHDPAYSIRLKVGVVIDFDTQRSTFLRAVAATCQCLQCRIFQRQF